MFGVAFTAYAVAWTKRQCMLLTVNQDGHSNGSSRGPPQAESVARPVEEAERLLLTQLQDETMIASRAIAEKQQDFKGQSCGGASSFA